MTYKESLIRSFGEKEAARMMAEYCPAVWFNGAPRKNVYVYGVEKCDRDCEACWNGECKRENNKADR